MKLLFWCSHILFPLLPCIYNVGWHKQAYTDTEACKPSHAALYSTRRGISYSPAACLPQSSVSRGRRLGSHRILCCGEKKYLFSMKPPRSRCDSHCCNQRSKYLQTSQTVEVYPRLKFLIAADRVTLQLSIVPVMIYTNANMASHTWESFLVIIHLYLLITKPKVVNYP